MLKGIQRIHKLWYLDSRALQFSRKSKSNTNNAIKNQLQRFSKRVKINMDGDNWRRLLEETDLSICIGCRKVWREKGENSRQREKHERSQMAGRSVWIQEEVWGGNRHRSLPVLGHSCYMCKNTVGSTLWKILVTRLRSWTCFVK